MASKNVNNGLRHFANLVRKNQRMIFVCILVLLGIFLVYKNRKERFTNETSLKMCVVETSNEKSKFLPVEKNGGQELNRVGNAQYRESEGGNFYSQNWCENMCNEKKDCNLYVYGKKYNIGVDKKVESHCRMYDTNEEYKLEPVKLNEDEKKWITVEKKYKTITETDESESLKFIPGDNSKVTSKVTANYNVCKNECLEDDECKIYSFNRSEPSMLGSQAFQSNHSKAINSPPNCLLFNTLDNGYLLKTRDMNWRTGLKGCGENPQLPPVSDGYKNQLTPPPQQPLPRELDSYETEQLPPEGQGTYLSPPPVSELVSYQTAQLPMYEPELMQSNIVS